MKLLVDEAELPDGLPVELSGTIIKGMNNKLYAWAGNGKNQIHIACEVIVAAQNPALSDEVGGADEPEQGMEEDGNSAGDHQEAGPWLGEAHPQP